MIGCSLQKLGVPHVDAPSVRGWRSSPGSVIIAPMFGAVTVMRVNEVNFPGPLGTTFLLPGILIALRARRPSLIVLAGVGGGASYVAPRQPESFTMSTPVARSFSPAGVALAALLACSSYHVARPDTGEGGPYGDVWQHSGGKPQPQASGPAYKKGVVAAANPYGAEAGAKILEQGGNAVDAAVAIAYALNVVEPQSAGIGGGGFMMIHLANTGETFFIDTREKAPAGATPNMFVGVPNATLQGVAVGVPGMVRGTALALERFGKLTLDADAAPAIKLADEGFAATPRYSAVSCNGRAQNSPESAAFFCPGGAPPAVGSLVQNKPLAATLRLIAENGPDCFYS